MEAQPVNQVRSSVMPASLGSGGAFDISDLARRIAKILKRMAGELGPICTEDIILRTADEILLIKQYRAHVAETKRAMVSAFMNKVHISDNGVYAGGKSV